MKNTLSLLCSTLAFMIGCLQRNNHKLTIAVLFALFISGLTNAQPLACTDELGRTLPQNTLVGAPDGGKTVAMFYFLWMGHSASATATNYCDLTKIIAAHPSVLNNYTDPYWGQSTPGYYYWGESIYNYYKGDDYWVHLRNVQLLTDAGVDILSFVFCITKIIPDSKCRKA